jgi:hypothetical protein
MPLEGLERVEPQKAVKQATVRDVHLRDFHLPLAEILAPGQELPDDEGGNQASRYRLTVVSATPKARANSDALQTCPW